MKKLYSLATLFILALLGMTASAASYTIEVNDASLVKSLKSMFPYKTFEFEGQNSVTIDIEDGYNIAIEPVDGYAITSVIAKTAAGGESSVLSSPTTNCSLSVGSLGEWSDGTTFVVTIEQLQASTFTLKVDDYTHIASVGNLDSFDSNEIEVSFTPLDSYIDIVGATASNGKYLIKSITYSDGTTEQQGYQSTSLNLSKVNAGDEVTVTTELKEMPFYNFEVTDLTHIKEVNYKDVNNFNPVGNTFTLVTEDSYFSIVPAEGYQILSIKCGDDDLYTYDSYPYFKSNSMTVYFRTPENTDIATGSTITVVTEERTLPKWTFNNANGINSLSITKM